MINCIMVFTTNCFKETEAPAAITPIAARLKVAWLATTTKSKWTGIVAKRRDSRYRSGRCRDWIKIKNPAHPAIERAMLIALSKRHRHR